MMDEVKIGGAALANVSLAGLQAWLTEYEPQLRMLLLLLQIGVAGLTVVYVGAKLRLIIHKWRHRNDD